MTIPVLTHLTLLWITLWVWLEPNRCRFSPVLTTVLTVTSAVTVYAAVAIAKPLPSECYAMSWTTYALAQVFALSVTAASAGKCYHEDGLRGFLQHAAEFQVTWHYVLSVITVIFRIIVELGK